MKKYIVSLALFLFTSLSFALAIGDWAKVSEVDDSVYAIQNGSVELSKTDGGTPVVVGVGRITNTTTGIVIVQSWYVALADCKRKAGKLILLDITGVKVGESSFVYKLGTVGSDVAETLCSIVPILQKKPSPPKSSI